MKRTIAIICLASFLVATYNGYAECWKLDLRNCDIDSQKTERVPEAIRAGSCCAVPRPEPVEEDCLPCSEESEEVAGASSECFAVGKSACCKLVRSSVTGLRWETNSIDNETDATRFRDRLFSYIHHTRVNIDRTAFSKGIHPTIPSTVLLI